MKYRWPRKRNPKPIVLVKWYDAYTSSETYDPSTAKGECGWPTVSVGMLVRSDREGVWLATDGQLPYADEKKLSCQGKHFIPRGMIVEEVVIKE